MNTPICSTCGCSLIRLGISQEIAVPYHYKENKYWFCCIGCLDLFKTNPEQFLQETSDLVVCPVCLAEKPIAVTVEQKSNGKTFNFCRCPYYMDMFRQEPEYFVKRLAWHTNFAGIFGESGECCAK